MLSHEICCDSQEVLCELGRSLVTITFVENHEGAVILRQEPVKEIESKARDPVAVGNHKVRDASSEDAFQNGLQPGTLEVDAGGDITEELAIGVDFEEVLFLAFEVFLLMGG